MTIEEGQSYKRLSALTESLGLRLDSGSALKGEILGYCIGIESVKSFFDMIFQETDIEKASGTGLSIYADMCNVDDALSIEEKRGEIITRLSGQFGAYPSADFASALKKLEPGLSYSSTAYSMTISSVTSENADILKALGNLIEEYVPPYVIVSLDGDGCTFDYWDSTPFVFEDYDRLNCPFSVLDTIKQID